MCSSDLGGEFLAERLAVGDAILVAGKARIGAEFRFADFFCEFSESAVIADADEDVAGAGRKDREGTRLGCSLPVRLGGLPCMK